MQRYLFFLKLYKVLYNTLCIDRERIKNKNKNHLHRKNKLSCKINDWYSNIS